MSSAAAEKLFFVLVLKGRGFSRAVNPTQNNPALELRKKDEFARTEKNQFKELLKYATKTANGTSDATSRLIEA